MKPGAAIHHRAFQAIKDGKWVKELHDIPVRVMAVAEGYAMVRRKGSGPFIVKVRDLTQKE